MRNFEIPVEVTIDEDLKFSATNFLAYMKAMQLPDPTGVIMSEQVNDLVVILVNAEITTPWKAYSALKHPKGMPAEMRPVHYTFDENGREYLTFPDLHEAAKILYATFGREIAAHDCDIENNGNNSIMLEIFDLMRESASRVTVKTPEGKIWAYVADDDEYPGIQVTFEDADKNQSCIALIEYTATEHSNGYAPGNPGEMTRERTEVPADRRGEDVGPHGHCFSVTPGLICRAWPDIYKDTEHRRVVYSYAKDGEGAENV